MQGRWWARRSTHLAVYSGRLLVNLTLGSGPLEAPLDGDPPFPAASPLPLPNPGALLAGTGFPSPFPSPFPSACPGGGQQTLKDHFLIRASAALEKLKLLCGEDKECSNPSNLLELYTQAILDMTYFEENKLVDEDFPEDSSEKVKELISFLSEPEILVKENNMHPKHCDLLGDELLECLSWRRGALLYMYCHSLTKRREWLTRKSSLLKKYLIDGISYLIQMLNFRCPIQLNEGVSFQDLDTAKLLSEGIFSDIHLLAMMYSGEMCYWGLKHCADQQPENHEVDTGVSGASYAAYKEPLDFREVGEKILKKYVSVCEGPLKEQEWNTTNAKQILNFFQHHTN
uniref:RAB7A interacting MON1-CCZ1 complex subunit 1 n=1 Tax=Sus scrofa TaxID=9823 RepID=A0A8D0JMZ0_PIG